MCEAGVSMRERFPRENLQGVRAALATPRVQPFGCGPGYAGTADGAPISTGTTHTRSEGGALLGLCARADALPVQRQTCLDRDAGSAPRDTPRGIVGRALSGASPHLAVAHRWRLRALEAISRYGGHPHEQRRVPSVGLSGVRFL